MLHSLSLKVSKDVPTVDCRGYGTGGDIATSSEANLTVLSNFCTKFHT